MKRKGFTLVELLIVVAVIGVLAAMMTMSSTEAIDSAGANTVLNNLQSLKTAAMSMYMEDSEVASYTEIKIEDTDVITKLAKYLGKKYSANSVSLGNAAGKYAIVGNELTWYVVYQLADSDTPNMRTKLAAKAKGADLLGQVNAPAATKKVIPAQTGDPDTELQADFGFSDYYQNQDGENAEIYIALKVR